MKKTSKPPLKEKLRALAEWLDLKELRRLRWQNILLLVAAGCINAIGVNMGLSQILCKHRNAVQIEQNLFKAEVAQAAAALFSK